VKNGVLRKRGVSRKKEGNTDNNRQEEGIYIVIQNHSSLRWFSRMVFSQMVF
jgi:hypothetical protein